MPKQALISHLEHPIHKWNAHLYDLITKQDYGLLNTLKHHQDYHGLLNPLLEIYKWDNPPVQRLLFQLLRSSPASVVVP